MQETDAAVCKRAAAVALSVYTKRELTDFSLS